MINGQNYGAEIVIAPWKSRIQYHKLPNNVDLYVFIEGDNTLYRLNTLSGEYHTNKMPPNTDYWTPVFPEAPGPFNFFRAAGMPEEVAVYPDWQQVIDWRILPSEYEYPIFTVDDDLLVTTRVYRGRDGQLGYIGETTNTFFVDDGQEPDFSKPPPAGLNPFKVYDNEGTLLRTENPSVVAVHENRLVLGSTNERPTTIWGSAVGAYNLFDEVVFPTASDSFQHEIASHRLENIKGLISRRELLVLTSSSEWLLQGADGGLIVPSSVAAHPLSEHGCADLAPLSVGSTVFFVQRKGTVPRAIVPADARQGWAARDIATLSSHLFVGHTIVDWAYAEDPWKILWLVRDDGILLSLTYLPEHELYAWAQHEITGGLVESIASIPEGTEDGVYLVVNRNGVRYLERMASRVITDVRDSMFLDGAVTYDGRNTDATKTATINGSTGAIFDAVTIDFSNEDSPGSAEGEVLQLDGVNYQITLHNGASNYAATIIDPKPADATTFGVARDDWAFCAQSVSGLTHLNGQAVGVLFDGEVITGKTVGSGSVSFEGQWASVIHVGLPFVSEFESLDAVNEKGRQKTIKSVIVELEGTRGGEVGATLSGNMTEMRTRIIEDGYGVSPLKRMEADTPIHGKWEKTGRVAVRQTAPLPLGILAIARDIEYGGR